MRLKKMKVKIKKINPNAVIPFYQTVGSAGADLYACLDKSVTLLPDETQKIGTGISVAIPEGLVGLVYARSGLACKYGVAPRNKVGVIDSDYRGEIIVYLHNHSNEPFTIENGERIAQLVLTPYYRADFDVCDTLPDTDRGANGFGSTGKK